MKISTGAKVYLLAIALVALGAGFSDAVLANYFKDAYDATTWQRGFIEFPRELPGILALAVVFVLAPLGDLTLATIAQALSAIGIGILAFYTPEFYTMTVILFFCSMGFHIYLPLQDSLAMTILGGKNGKMGVLLGKVKGLITVFSLIASLVVFFAFRYGVFSFKTPIKSIFIVASLSFLLAMICFAYLRRGGAGRSMPKTKLVFRKEYGYFYVLSIVSGVQKQIFLVYSPWLLIEMMHQGADTMAALYMISAFLGIFFLPFLGKLLDRFGLRKMFYADALSYIIIYFIMAFMAYNLYIGAFDKAGFALWIAFGLFIIDRLSSQMTLVRSVYINQIARSKDEVMSTMSLGVALDHVVAITASLICGIVWTNFGPHWVFLGAGIFSLINLVVAKIVPLK